MSPETPASVATTRRVDFVLSSPGARSVAVAFFFHHTALDAPLPNRIAAEEHEPMVRRIVRLQARSLGEWHCELELPVGWHEYLFLVDGAWVMDPDAANVCPDGFGGLNALRKVEIVAAAPAVASEPPVPVPLRPRRRVLCAAG